MDSHASILALQSEAEVRNMWIEEYVDRNMLIGEEYVDILGHHHVAGPDSRHGVSLPHHRSPQTCQTKSNRNRHRPAPSLLAG